MPITGLEIEALSVLATASRACSKHFGRPTSLPEKPGARAESFMNDNDIAYDWGGGGKAGDDRPLFITSFTCMMQRVVFIKKTHIKIMKTESRKQK